MPSLYSWIRVHERTCSVIRATPNSSSATSTSYCRCPTTARCDLPTYLTGLLIPAETFCAIRTRAISLKWSATSSSISSRTTTATTWSYSSFTIISIGKNLILLLVDYLCILNGLLVIWRTKMDPNREPEFSCSNEESLKVYTEYHSMIQTYFRNSFLLASERPFKQG